eukprot:scaffold26312_cov137-Cylindrotheca_fusiformis.AAC.3
MGQLMLADTSSTKDGSMESIRRCRVTKQMGKKADGLYNASSENQHSKKRRERLTTASNGMVAIS